MRELFQRDIKYLAGELPPQYRNAGGNTALAHLSRGHRLFDAAQFLDALEAYSDADTALRKVPGNTNEPSRLTLNAAIATSRADCHANLGDFDLAIAATDEALICLKTADHHWMRCRRQLLVADRRAFYLAWMGRCDAADMESEAVIGALRAMVSESNEYQTDLARSLDHRAEILERAHRLSEAALVATESTSLRRDFARKARGFRIPFLRSLVTLARIVGNLGDARQAVDLCVEAAATIAQLKGQMPTDLRAQIVTCHGRNLMQSGAHREGMENLIMGVQLFRRMTIESGGASVFRDAYAEVMLDLGRMHLTRDIRTAHRWLIRAAAQKRFVARLDDHPLHWASLAETLIDLGNVRPTEPGGAAARHYLRALDALEDEDILPGALPELVLALSNGLTTSSHDGDASRHFPRLARLLIRASEIADEAYVEFAEPRTTKFIRLWLEYFLDHDQPEAVLQLLSFAHGRRLDMLTRAELDARLRTNQASAEEKEFLDLRQRIHRLDLEMADIVSARSPSLIPKVGTGKPRGTAATSGQPGQRAGAALQAQREKLFRRYVAIRDELIAAERYPDLDPSDVDPEQLKPPAGSSAAVAVWCVPEVFGVERPPQLIVIFPGPASSLGIPVPELTSASQAYARMLASSRFGRSGTRGGSAIAGSPLLLAGADGVGAELWQRMAGVWDRLAEHLRTHGIDRLDMITHAAAHNLPWLGSCPETIQLRQFPSLNFFLRRNHARTTRIPSSAHPLILVVDDAWDDPLNTLYQVPLEVDAIRRIWPGAVIGPGEIDQAVSQEAAAVWVIGHCLNHQGHPLLRRQSQELSLGGDPLLQRTDLRIGLIYASTCYLGQTTDVRGEPVGLPSIASLRTEAPFAAGAIAPIDDLGAALMAILFHDFWRECESPRAAFDKARRALATGLWPPTALEVLRSSSLAKRQEIVARAQADSTIELEKVGQQFPGLAPNRLLAHQFRIRRQGQACIEFWQKSDDVSLWLATLYDASGSHGMLDATSRLVSWFG